MIDSSKRKKKKKGDEEKSNTNKNDVMDEWRMKAFALAALRRCFAYDSVNFLTQERFNQFAPLVAKHLAKDPPKESREYEMNTLEKLLDNGEDEMEEISGNESIGVKLNLGAESSGAVPPFLLRHQMKRCGKRCTETFSMCRETTSTPERNFSLSPPSKKLSRIPKKNT